MNGAVRKWCARCGEDLPRHSCSARERERREDSRFLRTVGVFLELLRTDARLDPEAAMTKAARATAGEPS